MESSARWLADWRRSRGRTIRLRGSAATSSRSSLRDFPAPALAHHVARAAIISVAQPIFIAGHEVRVTAGCGIAVAPLHGQEAVELIGNADLALSKAKSIGRGNSFVFVTALRKEAMTRRLFNMELHRALSDDEFVLVYQPQIRLADGALIGAEALIRWLHPKHGLLAPAAFLPALEGGSLAAAVGSWILDEACAQAALWRRSGAPDFRIGVNLFGAQFRTNDLASEVFSTLERHGLPPEALELEVTENIGLDHNVLETLQRLRDCGVGIAFDDFGTGYASLSLLKRYPLSRIKIDRCFVQSMLESERDASVIRAILYMARSFDLETTAEGVETEEQRESLRRLGCEEGQGFLFSRPLPAPQFADTFGIGMPPRKGQFKRLCCVGGGRCRSGSKVAYVGDVTMRYGTAKRSPSNQAGGLNTRAGPAADQDARAPAAPVSLAPPSGEHLPPHQKLPISIAREGDRVSLLQRSHVSPSRPHYVQLALEKPQLKSWSAPIDERP
jgi:EAL domain-containing protein (putative c-di-GMP-specific phosphodiesterase class I)